MNGDIDRPETSNLALSFDSIKALKQKTIAESVDEICHEILNDEEWTEIRDVDVGLLTLQLGAVINIQQWPFPGDFETPDPYYEETYTTWKDWLILKYGTGATVPETLSLFELRSLVLVRFSELLKELNRTIFNINRAQALRLLGGKCEIAGDLLDRIIEQALLMEAKPGGQTFSFLPSETGLGFIQRDRGGAAEEGLGIIQFECITNDREPAQMAKLLTLKAIFSRQLPKMPREYITRLTFDRQHYSFCLFKEGKIVGGVCFRPFLKNKFAEIVFLAVTSSEQVKGYGTRLMNHLKEYVRHRGIEYFLTYADNYALGYFRKQGFYPKISLPKDKWSGYIKDYDGGTLMECYISPQVNYLKLGEMFLQHRKRVIQAIRLLKHIKIHSGQHVWQNAELTQSPTQVGVADSEPPTASAESTTSTQPHKITHFRLNPSTVPGFVEAGWREELRKPRKHEILPLNDQVLQLVEEMLKHEAAWPFKKPVSKQEAPDYHEHIKQPMDISTIKKNAKAKLYKRKDEVGAHLKLMFDNCRYYNQPSSIYYKLADELEAIVKIGGINIYILDMVQKQLKKVKAAADRSSTKRKNVPSKSKEKVNMADKKFRKGLEGELAATALSNNSTVTMIKPAQVKKSGGKKKRTK